MALTERSSTGFLTGGVSDTVPDWLGSYDEGYTASQKQKETALSQQETKQRMAESAAAEQRRALEFANQQADRAAALKSYEGRVAPEEAPFNPQPGAGLMPEYQVPVAPEARAPSEKYADELAPPASTPAARLQPLFNQLETENNLPAGFLTNMSRLESSFGTNTQNGQFEGIFQIGAAEQQELGLTPEQVRDERTNAAAAAKIASRNAAYLRTALGREPKPWELYLAHQQGRGGAEVLLKNPNIPVVDALMQTAEYRRKGRAAAEQAVIQNGGNINMTAGQFASLWTQKFGGPQQPPQVAQTQGTITNLTEKFTREDNPQATWWANKLINMGEAEKRNAYEDIIYKVQPRNVILDELGGLGMSTEDYNKMRDERKQKVEAVQFFRREDVRKGILNDPQALIAAQFDPLGFYNAYAKSSVDEYDQWLAQTFSKITAGQQPVTPGVQTQPAAPAAPTTPGVQAPPPAAPPPGATTTAGVQAPPPAAPPPPTDLGLPNVAARDLIPGVGAADYAGLNDGTGSLASAIARSRRGEPPVTPDTGLYIVEPIRIENEMRLLANERQILLRRFEQARALRDFNAMNDIEDRIMKVDASNNLMQAMRVVAQAQQGDDNAMAQAMSGITGGRQRLQRRSDGSFNIYYDGQLRSEGISRDQIIASLRMAYDQQFQAQVQARAQAAAEREKEYYKGQIDIAKEIAKQQAQLIREIKVELQKAALKPAEYNFSTVGEVIFAIPKEPGTGEVKAYTMVPVVDMNNEPVVDGAGNVKMVPKETSLQNAVPVQ